MTKRKAFTLIELLVVVAIIALLISILLPSLSRARELSKRLACTANVKGIGTSCKIYANDNEDSWPVPTFNTTSTAEILWAEDDDIEIGKDATGGSETTPSRDMFSTGATNELSVTRAMWMMVRSGDLTPKLFTCPSSGDSPANEQSIDFYYDFYSYTTISYGYQVPFGPFNSRASENVDARMVLGGDKGPYYLLGDEVDVLEESTAVWAANPGKMAPNDWKPWNSPNHGGRGSGEGQNLLFGDGHAEFMRSPDAGIEQDNVYTRMYDPEKLIGRMGGELPGSSGSDVSRGGYPGEKSFPSGGTPEGDATTDSLIYP